MRSAGFWGAAVIIIGLLLLLNTLGVLSFDVWGVVWPALLIALGVWVLLGVFGGNRQFERQELQIPLQGAQQARLRIRYGAGRLVIGSGAGPDELLSGSFDGGVEHKVRSTQDVADVDLRVTPFGFHRFFMPWAWGLGGVLAWSLRLNETVPLELDMELGASDTRLDLSDLKVTALRLQTGASASELTLPANAGHTRVRISSGAASVNVRVPDGVAARIRFSGGLAGFNVDKGRFPRSGGFYQSPDYDTAANKVEIAIETGVGSVSVR